jgi:hypothetical protein
MAQLVFTNDGSHEASELRRYYYMNLRNLMYQITPLIINHLVSRLRYRGVPAPVTESSWLQIKLASAHGHENSGVIGQRHVSRETPHRGTSVE